MSVTPLRVLDLYAGLQGWGSAFRAAGHDVVTLDIDPAFQTTVVADALTVTVDQLGGPGAYDLVVASPPCEGFSVGSIGRHWDLNKASRVATPKSDTARLGVRLARRTCELIRDLAPAYGFAIENPTGMMRHVLGFSGPREVDGLTVERWVHPADRAKPTAPSVTYCTLGKHYRKPTDLWVGGPVVEALRLPAPCRTDRTAAVDVDGVAYRVNRWTGQPCHEVAARGARTGVQGLDSYAERSLVPTDLSDRFRLAAESLDLPRVGRSPDLDATLRPYLQEALL